MGFAEVFDELLEPFAFQFPTPHRAEECWQSSDDLLVTGHVSRNLLPGDRGEVEKLLFFLPGGDEKDTVPGRPSGKSEFDTPNSQGQTYPVITDENPFSSPRASVKGNPYR